MKKETAITSLAPPGPTIWEVAEATAKRNGCHGPVYFIHDKRGGYFQTASEHGAYNFRVNPPLSDEE